MVRISKHLCVGQNGIEYDVYDNMGRPGLIDLYMRRHYSKRIQAFHLELTPDEAEELAKDLMAKAEKVRRRSS